MQTLSWKTFCLSIALFSAQAFSSDATQEEFNGDGNGDILYRSTEDLTWRLDLINNASVTNSYPMSAMSSCCGWLFNGAGDFNNDGTSDVIIRNVTSGRWYIYNINTDSVIDRGYVAIEDATVIAVQAVADFNQDGYADVLLRNENTGEWNMTLLQNRTIINEITPPMSQVLTWSVVDAQDFDGNGSPDILIRNSVSGAWYLYLYSGTDITLRSYIRTILPTDLNEEVQAVADFDGDGSADVLLRNLTTNDWSMVLMNGLTPTSITVLDINDSSKWEFNAANDFNNDGKADISLRAKSTEQQYIYYMNGTSVVAQSYVDTSLPAAMSLASLRTITAPTDVSSDNVAYFNDGVQNYFNDNISNIINTRCIACHVSDGPAGGTNLIFSQSSVANYQAINRNVFETYVKNFGANQILAKASGSISHTGGTQFSVNSTDYNNLSTFLNYFDAATISSGSSGSGNNNSTPVANAGNDQSVAAGTTVTLNGSASSDADNDTLTYLWTLTSSPNDSNATINNATASAANFTADQIGSYVASLVVNDGTSDSSADTVTITANNTNVDITDAQFTNRSGDCRNYVGTYFANVTDVQRAVDFTGSVTITATDSTCSLSVNEIPNHDFNDQSARFAGNVTEQIATYQIPVNPTAASANSELGLGAVNAVTLNGVVIDILAAACYGVGNESLGQEKTGCGQDQIDNPWRYDPMSSLNNFGTDSHNAHPQPDGTYHYHGNPLAMYDTNCEVSATEAPVIGFAADGFPVYGPCFYDDASGTVRKATSSYQLKTGTRQAVSGYTTPVGGVGSVSSNNYDGQFRGDYEYQANSGDLDECNGMTVNGQYGYYLTDTYPWVLACLKGAQDNSFNKKQNIKQGIPHSLDGHTHY